MTQPMSEAELRARIAALETAFRLKLRAAQRKARREQLARMEGERSPWTHLPYLGVVPRHVGPGDPLRKL